MGLIHWSAYQYTDVISFEKRHTKSRVREMHDRSVGEHLRDNEVEMFC